MNKNLQVFVIWIVRAVAFAASTVASTSARDLQPLGLKSPFHFRHPRKLEFSLLKVHLHERFWTTQNLQAYPDMAAENGALLSRRNGGSSNDIHWTSTIELRSSNYVRYTTFFERRSLNNVPCTTWFVDCSSERRISLKLHVALKWRCAHLSKVRRRFVKRQFVEWRFVERQFVELRFVEWRFVGTRLSYRKHF
jgi:hypothetical protein